MNSHNLVKVTTRNLGLSVHVGLQTLLYWYCTGTGTSVPSVLVLVIPVLMLRLHLSIAPLADSLADSQSRFDGFI